MGSLEGALTPRLCVCQSAGLQFPLDLQLTRNCQKRPVVLCCAELISLSFRVWAGNEPMIAGRKDIIPRAWLWCKGHANIPFLPAACPHSPGSLAACRQEHHVVLGEAGYFIFFLISH